MEPPAAVRKWMGELAGVAPEGEGPAKPLEAWAVLGPALAAVNAAAVAMETEPATVLAIPGSPEVQTGPWPGGAV